MTDTDTTQDDARTRVIALVTQAEATVEVLEAKAPRGRWAMTAFSRYRVCELLGIAPYGRYDGELRSDPADLFDRAAGLVDEMDVAFDEVSWRLALGDALRSAAADVRMVRDAREV
jgi:hypothetical protein